MRAFPNDGLTADSLASRLLCLETSRSVSRDAGGRAWRRPFDPGGVSERSVQSRWFPVSAQRRAGSGGPREAARVLGEPGYRPAEPAYASATHFRDAPVLQISAARRGAPG